MASTLATRVGAGTIIAVGLVIVSFIIWRKRKNEAEVKSTSDSSSSVVTMKFSSEKDGRETMRKKLKENLKQTLCHHHNRTHSEEIIITTKLKVGKMSDKKITPVTIQRKHVYRSEILSARSESITEHNLNDIVNDLCTCLTVLQTGKPENTKPSTSTGAKQTGAKDTTVSASGDASFPQKSVIDEVSAVQDNMSGGGDGNIPDNYVCENGICRLVNEPSKTKVKQKVRFDPLAEAMTKSLTEFFEGRAEPENGTEDDKLTNSEIDRKETYQQKKEKDALHCTKPEEEMCVTSETVSKSACVESMIQPSEQNKVTSDDGCTFSPDSPDTQQGQESEKVISDQNQESKESEQGEESEDRQTNGVTDSYEEEDVWEVGRYDQDDIATAILVSQNSPGILSGGNAEILVALLSHPETKLQQAALNGIKKSSTFTRNQNLFREHGCLDKLSKLLRSQSMSLRLGVKSSQEVVSSVATAITNLSANTENHKNLEGCVPTLVELAMRESSEQETSCVPTLVDLTLEDETGESVCLSSLQALTNLSLTDQYHRHYTRLIQKLYDLLDMHQHSIQLQALKVLVNLSCSTEMVPHILAAKAPGCLLELLKQGSDEALTLRMTTFLANILHTVREENISVSSLPPDDKAPSPETMYAALYSMNNVGAIKSKVFLLCRHRNEDIKVQATRIYQLIAK